MFDNPKVKIIPTSYYSSLVSRVKSRPPTTSTLLSFIGFISLQCSLLLSPQSSSSSHWTLLNSEKWENWIFLALFLLLPLTLGITIQVNSTHPLSIYQEINFLSPSLSFLLCRKQLNFPPSVLYYVCMCPLDFLFALSNIFYHHHRDFYDENDDENVKRDFLEHENVVESIKRKAKK